MKTMTTKTLDGVLYVEQDDGMLYAIYGLYDIWPSMSYIVNQLEKSRWYEPQNNL